MSKFSLENWANHAQGLLHNQKGELLQVYQLHQTSPVRNNNNRSWLYGILARLGSLLTALLLTTKEKAATWMHSSCEQIVKLWHSHSMEYYSDVRKSCSTLASRFQVWLTAAAELAIQTESLCILFQSVFCNYTSPTALPGDLLKDHVLKLFLCLRGFLLEMGTSIGLR